MTLEKFLFVCRSRGGRGGDRDRDSDKRRPVWLDKYGPPTRTEYRVNIENLSSRVSWQDLKVGLNRLF